MNNNNGTNTLGLDENLGGGLLMVKIVKGTIKRSLMYEKGSGDWRW